VHWNGKTWKRVPSPSGGLAGMAATYARSAWAVRADVSGDIPRALILHRNGTA
jgi:hypothetical protein